MRAERARGTPANSPRMHARTCSCFKFVISYVRVIIYLERSGRDCHLLGPTIILLQLTRKQLAT
jgi:hypothetical protein